MDSFDWESRKFSYNLSNQLARRELDYDIGLTEITEWDLDYEEIWARRETDVEADDAENWARVEYYYDDNDVLYDTIYYPDAA